MEAVASSPLPLILSDLHVTASLTDKPVSPRLRVALVLIPTSGWAPLTQIIAVRMWVLEHIRSLLSTMGKVEPLVALIS